MTAAGHAQYEWCPPFAFACHVKLCDIFSCSPAVAIDQTLCVFGGFREGRRGYW